MRALSVVTASLFAVIICGYSNGVFAQESKRGVATREYTVIGQRSCADWNDARAKAKSDDIGGLVAEIGVSNWLLGFLSGVNYGTSRDVDLLNGVDYDVATEWVDQFCREHPSKKLPDAVKAMLSRLGRDP